MTESAPGVIRIGISSWGGLPGFYPSSIRSGDKLTWFARFFSVVEVNVSFYRIVPPATYDTWAEITPREFMFDVKAFSELTHFRESPPGETFAAFRDSYASLRDMGLLGGVLFQFPPRFADTSSSRAFCGAWGGKWQVMWRSSSFVTTPGSLQIARSRPFPCSGKTVSPMPLPTSRRSRTTPCRRFRP